MKNKNKGNENKVTEVQPQSVNVPKEYQDLGVKSGYEPVPANKLRQFILGPHGGGKTSFVSTIPEAIVIDPEGGAWGVPNRKNIYMSPTEYEDLDKVIEKLIGDKDNKVVTTVVFDTVEETLELLNAKLAEQYGVEDITQYGSHGAGYSLLKNEFMSMLRRLQRANYSWVCVGHLQEKKVMVNKKERTVQRPVLFKSIAQPVARAADIVATIHAETKLETVPYKRTIKGRTVTQEKTEEVTKVYYDTTGMGQSFGTTCNKRRGVPTLPNTIPLPPPTSMETDGWQAFSKVYKEAIKEIMDLVKEQ